MSRAASSFFPEWLDSRSDKSDFSPIPSHLLLLRAEECPAGYFKVHCSFSVGMRTVSKKDFNLKLWENDSYFLMKNIIVMFALCVLLLCIGFRGFFFFFLRLSDTTHSVAVGSMNSSCTARSLLSMPFPHMLFSNVSRVLQLA